MFIESVLIYNPIIYFTIQYYLLSKSLKKIHYEINT
jgi:hypothetical protein